ncbi:unnamed protein product [Urochloa humidicola]
MSTSASSSSSRAWSGLSSCGGGHVDIDELVQLEGVEWLKQLRRRQRWRYRRARPDRGLLDELMVDLRATTPSGH